MSIADRRIGGPDADAAPALARSGSSAESSHSSVQDAAATRVRSRSHDLSLPPLTATPISTCVGSTGGSGASDVSHNAAAAYALARRNSIPASKSVISAATTTSGSGLGTARGAAGLASTDTYGFGGVAPSSGSETDYALLSLLVKQQQMQTQQQDPVARDNLRLVHEQQQRQQMQREQLIAQQQQRFMQQQQQQLAFALQQQAQQNQSLPPASYSSSSRVHASDAASAPPSSSTSVGIIPMSTSPDFALDISPADYPLLDPAGIASPRSGSGGDSRSSSPTPRFD